MKRKWNKIILIIGLILSGFLLTVALTISPIAKWYIESHSKELIGRTARLQRLHLNIFTGYFEIDSIRLYERDDRRIFASVDTFAINMSYYKLLSSTVKLTEFRIIGPSIKIEQNQESFNFDDLKPKKDSSKKKQSSFFKKIILQNIFIRGGKISYTDDVLKNTIIMNDLGIAIPELCFQEGNTKAGIHLKIGSTASVNSTMAVDITTNQFAVDLKVQNLSIGMFTPYVKRKLNVGKVEGTVSSDIQIKGDMNHPMNLKLNGTVTASAFNITNSLGELLASADSASTKIDSVSLLNQNMCLIISMHPGLL